jgi:monoamine oxidase
MTRVTIVEADDRLGGRIRSDALHRNLGAEIIHGSGTVLTDLIQELGLDMEPIFITSHADGGPDDAPTPSGKYGMYYIDGQLTHFQDPKIQTLSQILRYALFDDQYAQKYESLGEAIDAISSSASLESSLRQLAISSYANTAGCSDLYQLSLPVLHQFETYWHEHEIAGDFYLQNKTDGTMIPMTAIVDGLVRMIDDPTTEMVQIRLDWKVQKIQQQPQLPISSSSSDSEMSILLTSETGETIEADIVVVTVPPPALRKMDISMPEWTTLHERTLDFIGFDNVVKVMCIFSQPHWPTDLQSIVVGDGLAIPEIWFRTMRVDPASAWMMTTRRRMNQSQPSKNPDDSTIVYLAVGFLASQAADDFMKQVMSKLSSCSVDECQTDTIDNNANSSPDAVAGALFVSELAQVLNVSENTLQESLLDACVYDWSQTPHVGGGYMHPKVGLENQHLSVWSSSPLMDTRRSLYFAGEATHAQAACTIQAAMETGIRAAQQIVEEHAPMLNDGSV